MTHFLKLDINGIYGSFQPIKPNFEVIKKELTGNDWLKLFGALSMLAHNNMDTLFEYYNLHVGDVIDTASISDNELYLFSFEGFELNERYTIKTLYLTNNDRVIMSVYDNKKDRYIDFLAD